MCMPMIVMKRMSLFERKISMRFQEKSFFNFSKNESISMLTIFYTYLLFLILFSIDCNCKIKLINHHECYSINLVQLFLIFLFLKEFKLR